MVAAIFTGPVGNSLCTPSYLFLWDFLSAISHEAMDLRHNTRLETLSFWRCGPPFILCTGVAGLDQMTSSNLRELNVSFRDCNSIVELSNILEAGPEGLWEQAAIDTLLQCPTFANLERVNIGLPRAVDSMQNFLPRTAARGLLHVMSGSEMARLARAKDHVDEPVC